MIAKTTVIIIPLIFLISFVYAARKKVKLYDSFTTGIKNAPPLILSIFPYIAAVTMMTELLNASGLSSALHHALTPLFQALNVPSEIVALVIVKPFSASGSIAVLSDIFAQYGVDSHIAHCACVAYSASDTIFYISAVYFAGVKRKALPIALAISLLSYFCALVFGCFLCKFI